MAWSTEGYNAGSQLGLVLGVSFPTQPLRTQLLPCERQEGRVLIQVLIEVDAQQTQLFLDAFDFLQERAIVRWRALPSKSPKVGVPPQKR